jgi:hypothetical protein
MFAGVAVLIAVGAFTAVATAAPRAITVVAGNGKKGYAGDHHAAIHAKLDQPRGVAALRGGGFLIADTDNAVIRKVSPRGKISTVAGGGTGGVTDSGPARSVQLAFPDSVSPLHRGGFLIADTTNSVIRKVSAAGGISTVAGTGMSSFGGDNGPATAAQIFFPQSVAALPRGGFLIADSNNERIREVSPGGEITTVAGNGMVGYMGDNGPATMAKLFLPTAVSPTSGGGFLIADSDNSVIREVSGGTITTVAGKATAGYSGDGGPATMAELLFPIGVSALDGGGFLIADTTNGVIRKVSAAGRISTVAGHNVFAAHRARRSPTSATLHMPTAVAPLPGGAFLIADSQANQIRWVGTPPKTRITRHPHATERTARRKLEVRFAFHSNQAHSTFKCRLDHSPFRTCHSPKRFRVGPGKHTLRVRSVNRFHATGPAVRFRFRVVSKS